MALTPEQVQKALIAWGASNTVYNIESGLVRVDQPYVAQDDYSVTHIVPEGIIVETSSGHTSLLVTRIDDRTVIEANRDGFTGYEDTEAIVSGADLLANDMLGGFVGSIQSQNHERWRMAAW